MKKRTVSIIISLSLAFCIAGCGGKEAGQTASSSGSAESSVSEEKTLDDICNIPGYDASIDEKLDACESFYKAYTEALGDVVEYLPDEVPDEAKKRLQNLYLYVDSFDEILLDLQVNPDRTQQQIERAEYIYSLNDKYLKSLSENLGVEKESKLAGILKGYE